MANKKSFHSNLSEALNPAMQFISAPEKQIQESPKEETPAGYYQNPRYLEKKSRRLQLLMKPSLYEKLKQQAEQTTNGSVNEAIHSILEEALNK